MWHVHVHVLIETSHQVKLVVVPDRLTPTEFLRLAQWAVIEAFDLRGFSVVGKSVGDPAIVTAENDDFRVGEREGSYGVTGRPEGIVFSDFDDFPFLLFEF